MTEQKYAVPWAGKIVIACQTHANQIANLGNIIGSPVEVRPIETEQPCSNCENEKQANKANNNDS